MQSPAACTLTVKLLTSTNDFLMISPMSHKTVYSQTIILRHALHATRVHSHTPTIMSFIRGSVVSWIIANVIFKFPYLS